MANITTNTLLSSSMIDDFMAVLMEKSNAGKIKIYTFSTDFFVSFGIGGVDRVSRWTRKVKLIDYDIILFPVHEPFLGGHWYLIAVFTNDKVIRCYDSLRREHQSQMTNCLKYIKVEFSKLGTAMNEEEWTLEGDSSGLDKQHNGKDCGFCVCLYAFCLTQNINPFSIKLPKTEALRGFIVWVLTQGKANPLEAFQRNIILEKRFPSVPSTSIMEDLNIHHFDDSYDGPGPSTTNPRLESVTSDELVEEGSEIFEEVDWDEIEKIIKNDFINDIDGVTMYDTIDDFKSKNCELLDHFLLEHTSSIDSIEVERFTNERVLAARNKPSDIEENVPGPSTSTNPRLDVPGPSIEEGFKILLPRRFREGERVEEIDWEESEKILRNIFMSDTIKKISIEFPPSIDKMELVRFIDERVLADMNQQGKVVNGTWTLWNPMEHLCIETAEEPSIAPQAVTVVEPSIAPQAVTVVKKKATKARMRRRTKWTTFEDGSRKRLNVKKLGLPVFKPSG